MTREEFESIIEKEAISYLKETLDETERGLGGFGSSGIN